MAKKVPLIGYRCERCKHEWLPRNKDIEPKVCPKCKSPYWDTPKKKSDVIYTIGYEDLKPDEFIKILLEKNIKQLFDIRLNAFSRKNGFSKGLLTSYLKEVGIRYKHFPSLGSPKALRQELYQNRDYKKFFEEYKKHIIDPDVVEELKDLEFLSKARKTVLMCYEKNPEYCHRSIIANILKLKGWKVVDLNA